ncbi:transcriptional regulator [Longispora fulva]|uniref:AcrR family transcriptional regulator n=1 Tax=Longispora fulva TaxID=619741 RepID=A0A8J7GKJ9_9ACTN|nr:TetR/AcrR family transcriptional regulator [Longispora fulva]MBG6139886.1 AcrR family transcriptional regulator [Longispora fulva]GIG57729.1 transcriptional regulator [Longispora fulva]
MSLPVPPWEQRPQKRRSTKQPLSQEAIVAAAFKILDAEGLEAVTMRRIADELDTGPASLYAHVANKDELYALLLDQAAGEVRLPAPDAEHWQDRAKDFLRDLNRVLISHKDLGRAALARIPVSPNALASSEALLAILRTGGVPDQDCAWAADILSLYVVAHAYENGLQQLHGDEDEGMAYVAAIGEYFHQLPSDRFPNIVGLAGLLTTGDGDVRFEFGLDLLIRGLAARAEEARKAHG